MAVAAEENKVCVLVAITHIECDVRSRSIISRCRNVPHLSDYANGIIITFRYEEFYAAVRHRASPGTAPPYEFERLRVVIPLTLRRARLRLADATLPRDACLRLPSFRFVARLH